MRRRRQVDPDFRAIRMHEGRQETGFEEFCCQIARRATDVPPGSAATRLRGAGGDGGVEFVWTLPNGDEWGLQAKYLFNLDKAQLDKSVETALTLHPRLTRYTICLPFDLTGPTARKGTSQVGHWQEYNRSWEQTAKTHGMTVDFQLWTKSDLLDALLQFDPNGGRLQYWFDENYFGELWFKDRLGVSIRAAEPRYTPQLSVDVPLNEAFEAFGRTSSWDRQVHRRVRGLTTQRRVGPTLLLEVIGTGVRIFPRTCARTGRRCSAFSGKSGRQ